MANDSDFRHDRRNRRYRVYVLHSNAAIRKQSDAATSGDGSYVGQPGISGAEQLRRAIQIAPRARYGHWGTIKNTIRSYQT